MKPTAVFLALVAALALVGVAMAQPGSGGGMGMGGMGPGGMGGRMYDPQTVATVKGMVEKVEEVTMARGMAIRELRLKTDQGARLVHLGPTWFLEEKKFAVKVGDTVEVTGSQVTLNNQPALIAREVTVNGVTLKLRDDQGIPVWRGMGRGPGGGPGMGPGPGPGKGGM